MLELVLTIFLAEMCVVTLGTLRIIFVARGNRVLAPLLGFFEVLIWLFAISQVMKNLDSGACFLAFALGFTLGNFLGIVIEKKLALGMASVRIITSRPAATLMDQLRSPFWRYRHGRARRQWPGANLDDRGQTPSTGPGVRLDRRSPPRRFLRG